MPIYRLDNPKQQMIASYSLVDYNFIRLIITTTHKFHQIYIDAHIYSAPLTLLDLEIYIFNKGLNIAPN